MWFIKNVANTVGPYIDFLYARPMLEFQIRQHFQ